MEEGEEELEEEGMSEGELDALEAAALQDEDIEEAYKSTKGSSKKSSEKKSVLGKRPRHGVELNYEYEHEREDVKSKSMDKVKTKPRVNKTVDF